MPDSAALPPVTYSCGVCGAKFPDNGEAWIEHVRECVSSARYEARQAGVADLAEARQVIAEQIDMPSVYMGGPSSRATRVADDVLDALTAHGFLLYRVDIPQVN